MIEERANQREQQCCHVCLPIWRSAITPRAKSANGMKQIMPMRNTTAILAAMPEQNAANDPRGRDQKTREVDGKRGFNGQRTASCYFRPTYSPYPKYSSRFVGVISFARTCFTNSLYAGLVT